MRLLTLPSKQPVAHFTLDFADPRLARHRAQQASRLADKLEKEDSPAAAAAAAAAPRALADSIRKAKSFERAEADQQLTLSLRTPV